MHNAQDMNITPWCWNSRCCSNIKYVPLMVVRLKRMPNHIGSCAAVLLKLARPRPPLLRPLRLFLHGSLEPSLLSSAKQHSHSLRLRLGINSSNLIVKHYCLHSLILRFHLVSSYYFLILMSHLTLGVNFFWVHRLRLNALTMQHQCLKTNLDMLFW